MDSREETIISINKALKNMKSKGFEGTDDYLNLMNKRDAIVNGCDFKVRDVTAEHIASMGVLMCNTNHLGTGGKIYTTEQLAKGVQEAIDLIVK